MKKAMMMVLVLAVVLTAIAMPAASADNAYVGTWVLDEQDEYPCVGSKVRNGNDSASNLERRIALGELAGVANLMTSGGIGGHRGVVVNARG